MPTDSTSNNYKLKPDSDYGYSRSMRGRSIMDEVQFVKGAGAGFAELLRKLDIKTVFDLLNHAPARYEDRSKLATIRSAPIGVASSFLVTVLGVENCATSRKRIIVTRVEVADDSGGIATLIFFGQPSLERKFQVYMGMGTRLFVYGSPRINTFDGLEIESPAFEEVESDQDLLSLNRIVPVYRLTEGVMQQRLRLVMHNALETFLPTIDEPLPDEIRKRLKFLGRAQAYRSVHFPRDFGDVKMGKRRLIFEEFFKTQVLLAFRRSRSSQNVDGPKIAVEPKKLMNRLADSLHFKLTNGQVEAITDILRDMSSGKSMNRLVQGDVGCGKTLVAIGAIMAAVEAGHQVAMMAPTEILAEQHMLSLTSILAQHGISVGMLKGSMRSKNKSETLLNLASGKLDVVVGTHAIIQDGVEFSKLGLVIVDEQHRFGVKQRLALHKKGNSPHVLVMTATPIPRTLTMTYYGDLDTSVIKDMPPGRKPIKTHWKPNSEALSVYQSAQKLIEQGRQIFVVCPLIEESEKLDIKAAVKTADYFQTVIYPGFKVELLHGQQPPEVKSDIMERFARREIDVLVSTTVIEVGIDVPNATIMIIQDADRFGLSQLHQLRGRVGRGNHPSFCILLSDGKTLESRKRLNVMTETNDGFRIAEEDLMLRGPGEYLGVRQSGIPDLHFGDLIKDFELLDLARQEAVDLVAADPLLSNPSNALLLKSIKETHKSSELLRVS